MRCRSYPKTMKPSITTPEYAKLYQEDNNELPSPDTSDEQLLPANESLDEFSDSGG